MTPAQTTNPSFDPGLTRQYTGPLLRAINKDGSFNVQRDGFRALAGNAYIHLVRISWPRFLGVVATWYLVVNGIFAGVFLALGPGALSVTARDLRLGDFG